MTKAKRRESASEFARFRAPARHRTRRPIRRWSCCVLSCPRSSRAASTRWTAIGRSASSRGCSTTRTPTARSSSTGCSRALPIATASVQTFFLERFEAVARPYLEHRLLTIEQQLLIGAYFAHEYSYQAAALFNPSIVPHPDQSGAPEGGLPLPDVAARSRRRPYFLDLLSHRHDRRRTATFGSTTGMRMRCRQSRASRCRARRTART